MVHAMDESLGCNSNNNNNKLIIIIIIVIIIIPVSLFRNELIKVESSVVQHSLCMDD